MVKKKRYRFVVSLLAAVLLFGMVPALPVMAQQPEEVITEETVIEESAPQEEDSSAAGEDTAEDGLPAEEPSAEEPSAEEPAAEEPEAPPFAMADSLPAAAPAQVFAPMSAYAYHSTATVSKLNNQGQLLPPTALGPGDTLNFNFLLTVTTFSEGILSVNFPILIHNNLFEGLDLGRDIDIANKEISEQTGILAFKGSKLYRDASLDSGDYYGYYLQLNDSDAAKALYQMEGGGAYSCSFTVTLKAYLEETGQVDGFQYEGDDGGSIKVEEIDVDGGKNPTPGTLVTEKAIWRVYQDTKDGNYLARTRIGAAPFVVGVGDLVIFTITVKNPNQYYEVSLKEVWDVLPTGYSLVGLGTPFNIKENSGDTAVPKTLGQVQGFYSSWTTPNWSLQSGNRYRSDSGLPLTLGKKGSGSDSYTTYLFARVESTADRKQLINSAYAMDSADNQGEPGTNNPPVVAGEMDLALQVDVSRVYSDNGTNQHQQTVYDQFTVKVLAPGSYVGVDFIVHNQGDTAKDIQVVAYVPDGFEVVGAAHTFQAGSNPPANGNNTAWAATGLDAYAAPSGAWCTPLSGQVINVPGTLTPGTKTTVTLFLRVKDDAQSRLELDFYIAGEICGFADENGDTTKLDIDSTPDKDPTNDLIDNRFGWSDVHPLNVSPGKEKSNQISENARDTSKLQDEDDYDYTFIKLLQADNTTQTQEVLQKERLAKSDVATSIGDMFNNYTLKNYLYANFTPMGDNGVITANNVFAVYEMWVNKDGLADTNGMTFTDQLPRGLKFAAFDLNGNTCDAVRVYKYVATARVPAADDPSKQVISYQPGYTNSYTLVYNGAPGSNLRTDYLNAGSIGMTMDPAQAGVKANITGENNLTIQFGAPTGTNPAVVDTHCSYRILAVVLLDTNEIHYEAMQNRVTLQGNNVDAVAMERRSIERYGDAGVALVRKGARAAGSTDDFAASPNLATAVPQPNGDVLVEYQIRYRSKEAFALGAIRVVDTLPQGAAFDGPVALTGYTYNVVNGQLVHGQPLGTLPLTASVSGNVLTVSNTLAATAEQTVYYATFTVRYSAWNHGETIINTANGSRALTSVPLRLAVEKQDAASGLALPGFEFAAFYAGTTSPVLDVNGAPLVFDDTHPSYYFQPTGLLYGQAKSWQIDLVETRPPTGYESNRNNRYRLTVSSDNAGNLSFADPTLADGFTIQYGAHQAATAQVPNTRDGQPGNLILQKVDADDAAKTLAGARFTLTRPDGAKEALETAADGSVTIALPQAGYEGQYTLLETQAPTGYVIDYAGAITFTVDVNGKITALSGGGDVVILGGNRMAITVRNSAIPAQKEPEQPTLPGDSQPQGPAPQTGDPQSLVLWGGLLLAAAAWLAATALLLRGRRRKKGR